MKILLLNVRGFGGSYKKISLRRLLKRVELDIILFQETMVSGIKVRESLNSILKDWCIYTLYSKGLSRGLCSSWNPLKTLFNTYQSSARIVLEGKVQGWIQMVTVVNCYGPYSNRKYFWNRIMEDG